MYLGTYIYNQEDLESIYFRSYFIFYLYVLNLFFYMEFDLKSKIPHFAKYMIKVVIVIKVVYD